MLAPVVDGDDALDGDVEAGFFLGFLDGVRGNRLVDVTPAARQAPFARALVHEQQLAVLEDGCARVDLRRLVALFVAEELADLGERQVALGGHHLGCDVAQLGIALEVEPVMAVVESGLREALDPHDPVEPLLLARRHDALFHHSRISRTR